MGPLCFKLMGLRPWGELGTRSENEAMMSELPGCVDGQSSVEGANSAHSPCVFQSCSDALATGRLCSSTFQLAKITLKLKCYFKNYCNIFC